MTRDEIKLPPYLCASYEGDDLFSGDQLMDVVRAAVLAEREACAKVCDGVVDAEYKTGKVDHNEMGWTQACAIAIRARSKT